MEKNNLSNISFDYYDETISYVKMIMKRLKNEDNIDEKEYIVKKIYNYLLSSYSSEMIEELVTTSLLFESRLNKMKPVNASILVQSIYKNYLEKLIFNYYDRENVFEEMNEEVKSIVGFYGIFKPYYSLESSNELTYNRKMR